MKKISAAAGAASDKLQQARARPLRGLARCVDSLDFLAGPQKGEWGITKNQRNYPHPQISYTPSVRGTDAEVHD